MFRNAIIPVLALVLTGAPALAVELPDTLEAEIMTLIPDAELAGRDFSQEEVDALQAAMGSGDDPAAKTAQVQKLLDEGLEGEAAR